MERWRQGLQVNVSSYAGAWSGSTGGSVATAEVKEVADVEL